MEQYYDKLDSMCNIFEVCEPEWDCFYLDLNGFSDQAVTGHTLQGVFGDDQKRISLPRVNQNSVFNTYEYACKATSPNCKVPVSRSTRLTAEDDANCCAAVNRLSAPPCPSPNAPVTPADAVDVMRPKIANSPVPLAEAKHETFADGPRTIGLNISFPDIVSVAPDAISCDAAPTAPPMTISDAATELIPSFAPKLSSDTAEMLGEKTLPTSPRDDPSENHHSRAHATKRPPTAETKKSLECEVADTPQKVTSRRRCKPVDANESEKFADTQAKLAPSKAPERYIARQRTAVQPFVAESSFEFNRRRLLEREKALSEQRRKRAPPQIFIAEPSRAANVRQYGLEARPGVMTGASGGQRFPGVSHHTDRDASEKPEFTGRSSNSGKRSTKRPALSQEEGGSGWAEDVIGKRLRIYWADDGKWYKATVRGFLPASGKHRVVYDDGDKEHVLLEKEKIKWIAD